MIILDVGQFLPLIVIGGLLGFFGLLVLVIILVKRHFKPLQIEKDDLTEEEAIKEELDRILVPIDDEEVQKQMMEQEASSSKDE